MVIVFECPWYVNGVGGMVIENQVLTTEEVLILVKVVYTPRMSPTITHAN